MTATKYLEIFGMTDKGCVRSANEDCFLVQVMDAVQPAINTPDRVEVRNHTDFMMAVADGMGGAAAGGVASSTALGAVSDYLLLHRDALAKSHGEARVRMLEKSVHVANQAIFDKAKEMGIQKPMGATITAAYITNDVAYIFQIGDSRAYIMRSGKLYRITRDQSFVGHLVEMGTITEAQAHRHPQRNVILQALGTQENLKVDVSYLTLCKGDFLFLCSDGLYSEIGPDRILEVTENQSNDGLQGIVSGLIDGAKETGGRDNITVLGLIIHEGMPLREPGEDPAYQPFPFLQEENPLEKSDSLFH